MALHDATHVDARRDGGSSNRCDIARGTFAATRLGMSKRLLSRLFPELGADGFLAGFPERSMVGKPGRDGIAELLAEPLLTDPERLLAAAPTDVYVAKRTPDGIVDLTTTPRDAALAHLRAGLPIEIPCIERVVPAIAEWQEKLDAELGFRDPSAISCSAFVSFGNDHSGTHFDSVEVLNIQVLGTKHWLLAENRDVAFAAHPYFPLRNGHATDTTHAGYFPARLQVPTPEQCSLVEMQPGTAQLIPRGMWHRVQTVTQPSLSIGFVLNAPLAMSVLLKVLREQLFRDEDARRPLAAVSVRRAEARAHLERVRARIDERLANLDLDALVAPDDHVLVRTGQLVLRPAERELEVTALRANEQPVQLKLDAGLGPLVSWIARREEPFSDAQARDAAPDVPYGQLQLVLKTFVRIGALVRSRPQHTPVA
jgi:hypothetical protein